MPNPRPRFGAFLLVSAVVHTLGLGAWQREPITPSEHALGEPLVTVLVPEGTRPAETQESDSAISMKTNKQKAAKTAAATRSPAEASAQARESVDDDRRRSARNALLGEIQTRLSQHLIYPPLARHRGWQGEVVLDFAIESDGEVRDVRIARSSGYDILDQSARDSLLSIGRLTPGELQLAGPIADLRLPVIYRLTEN